MPYQTIWVEPDLYFEYLGVKVFFTYDDENKDGRTNQYLFTTNAGCSELESRCDDEPCRHFFDVRELSTWKAPVEPPPCVGENNTPENYKAWSQYWKEKEEAIENAIKAAIDCGELTSHGFSLFERPAPSAERSTSE